MLVLTYCDLECQQEKGNLIGRVGEARIIDTLMPVDMLDISYIYHIIHLSQ